MGTSTDNVISMAGHRAAPLAPFDSRVHETREIQGKSILFRDATPGDVSRIQSLYALVYRGKYPEEFAVNPARLETEITDREGRLWLVAEDNDSGLLAGAMVFRFDRTHRLGKAAGVVVLPEYRSGGMATMLLQLGRDYLTNAGGLVDVIYATTRTINEAPSRVVAEAGFHQMGLFPNAVEVDNFEHFNLDVYLTEKALSLRRRKPYLFPAFQEIYAIARAKLSLELPYVVTERAPLAISHERIPLRWMDDAREAAARFDRYSREGRVSNSFFPFHRPNRVLESEDVGTEVFVWHAGTGKQAAIVGFRTDRVHVHELLNSVALALQKAGAAYVELLVDAYNYHLQQEAFTARFLPSAYFPAMKLHHDGLRDDFFILSRTFHLLDFTGTYVKGESLKYLRAYLRYYHDLYIKPILE